MVLHKDHPDTGVKSFFDESNSLVLDTPLSVMHRTQSPFACFSLLDYCNQFCTASYYLIKAGSCRFIVPFVHKEKAYNRQADVMFNQICSFKYFFESTYGSF